MRGLAVYIYPSHLSTNPAHRRCVYYIFSPNRLGIYLLLHCFRDALESNYSDPAHLSTCPAHRSCGSATFFAVSLPTVMHISRLLESPGTKLRISEIREFLMFGPAPSALRPQKVCFCYFASLGAPHPYTLFPAFEMLWNQITVTPPT